MNAKVYYHFGRPEKIEAILRDGFTNNLERKQNGMRGVFVADPPGELDPDYPDDPLLEISLSAEINLAKWKLVIPQRTWHQGTK